MESEPVDNEILSEKNLSQTAHTDSADANEMDMQRFMKIYLIHNMVLLILVWAYYTPGKEK